MMSHRPSPHRDRPPALMTTTQMDIGPILIGLLATDQMAKDLMTIGPMATDPHATDLRLKMRAAQTET